MLEPLLPATVFMAALTCATGIAALANCAVLAALLRRPQTGLQTIIAHLLIADVLLLAFSIVPELWSINSKTWSFGSSGCVAYQGLNVFTSISSQYLVVMIALHSLVTATLEERAAVKRTNSKCHNDEEMRSSRRSLMTNSNSSTPRTKDMDYRLVDTTVSVILPLVFVWFTAASVSVPQFLSAFAVSTDVLVCTDSIPSPNIRFLLTVFNLFLPISILSIAFALILVKLKSRKLYRFEMDNCESLLALKLSMWLIVVHGFCMPRNMANAYYAHVESINEHVIPKKNSQINNDAIVVINMIFGSASIVATCMRPILCIILIPHVRAFFLCPTYV